jgi:uncharacterized repeat protein (TIGR02543 family)
MQGIIFEVNKNKAVALDSEGRFVNLKNRGYVVGEKVELGRAQRHTNSMVMRLATACVLVLAIALGVVFGGLFYADNYVTRYTVQMDINPSVTLYINAKEVVIKAEGNNTDGKSLNPNALKGGKIDDYLAKYLDLCAKKGFISADKDNTVAISVSGKKAGANTSALSARIENTVRREFDSLGIPVTTETENGTTLPDKKKQITVRYDYNFDGAPDGGLFLELQIESGALIPRPNTAPERTGYYFLYWSKEQSGRNPSNIFDGIGTPTAEDNVELYAVWRAEGNLTGTATVTFVSLIKDDKTTVVYYRAENQALGDRPAYPTDDPTRVGFIFMGWSKSADTVFALFEGTDSEDHSLNGDMTLYAVWKPV